MNTCANWRCTVRDLAPIHPLYLVLLLHTSSAPILPQILLAFEFTNSAKLDFSITQFGCKVCRNVSGQTCTMIVISFTFIALRKCHEYDAHLVCLFRFLKREDLGVHYGFDVVRLDGAVHLLV